ncbi:MAG: MFS transporter, partial [Bacteroidaceae bacterium]|nr:MFS transporter [Bacteroidaceae bacterium]
MANKPYASLTSKQYLVPFVLVTSLFFLWGFARAILDVLNKHFQNSLDISLTQASLVQVITYMGYFLMALPAGLFINRFGYRRGVVTGLMLYAAGAFLFIPCSASNAFTGYLGALFVIACGLAFLETSANPYATELGPRETATSRLNLAQSFNGMGSALAPMLVGAFLFTNVDADVSMPYIVMGVVTLIAAFVFFRSRLPEIKEEEVEEASQQTTSGWANLRTLMHNRMFLFGLSALLAYEVAEISINSYFVTFATDMQWMAAD